MVVIFGPSGLGGIKEAVSNLEKYSKLGIKACEIAFTYGVYIKNEKDSVIAAKGEAIDSKLAAAFEKEKSIKEVMDQFTNLI